MNDTQVNIRIPQELLDEVDREIVRVERETRIKVSRAAIVRRCVEDALVRKNKR